MTVISTGQFTIIDYYDAVSLTGFISANAALTQVYNPDNNSYSPDYASSNMVFTPSLFKSGSGTDIITSAKSINWYDGATEITDGTTYGYPAFVAGSNRPLTIKSNVLTGSITSKNYTCVVVYTDTGTGLDLTYKTSITISRISNSAGVTVPVAFAPSGNVFKNNTGTLSAQAQLWRGAALDSSSLTYQWYKMDNSVVTDQGAGTGWLKLISTATGGGTSGYDTGTLTVPAGAVDGTATFKVGIKDTDSASPTYNQTFWTTISYIDQTDPIQVVVDSSGGSVFKQGNGSTTLTAKLYQNGAEIDTAGTAYTYKWYKRDKDGNSVANFGGTGVTFKTGKTLAVGSADVDAKATFSIEIS
jgi:hypothetical protein